MGWDQPDVYYQPERFGLTPVAEIDYSSGMYEFHLRIVWRHSSGLLLTARDAGCSCPSPFEDLTSLEQVDIFDYDEIEAEVAQHTHRPKWAENDDWWEPDVTPMQAADFLNKVRIASRDAVKPSEVETSIRRQIQAALVEA